MKYLKKLILIILIIILILLLGIFLIIKQNKKYETNLIKEIQKNYQINDTIKKINKYDSNYIIITNNNIIVLNTKYEKLKEEQKNKLAKNKNKYILVYKNNNLVYENTILKKDKVVYEYYDAYTYEYLDNIILEE